MPPVRDTIAYKADLFKSLEEFRGSCQRDEGDLTSKIVEIKLAKDDGVDATAVIYEEVEDIGSVGHDLIFVEFKDEVDRQSQMALHEKVNKETFLCKGQGYINSKPINVLAFRGKSQSSKGMPKKGSAQKSTAKKSSAKTSAKKGSSKKSAAGKKSASKKSTKKSTRKSK
jgi:hypothetical protein